MMQEHCRLANALSVFVLINLCATFRVGLVWIYECKKSAGTIVRYLCGERVKLSENAYNRNEVPIVFLEKDGGYNGL